MLKGVNKFNLNMRGDVSDATNFLLNVMHAWMQSISAGGPPEIQGDNNTKLERLFAMKCKADDDSEENSCFVHNMFHINKYQMRICSCHESVEKTEESNLYFETVSANGLLEKLE